MGWWWRGEGITNSEGNTLALLVSCLFRVIVRVFSLFHEIISDADININKEVSK